MFTRGYALMVSISEASPFWAGLFRLVNQLQNHINIQNTHFFPEQLVNLGTG